MRVLVVHTYCDVCLHMREDGAEHVEADTELTIVVDGEPWVLALCEEDGAAIVAADLPALAKEHGILERKLPQLEPSKTAKARVRKLPEDATPTTTPAGKTKVPCTVCGELKAPGTGMSLHTAARHPQPRGRVRRRANDAG